MLRMAVISLAAALSLAKPAAADELNQQQLQIIDQTAVAICNTVTQAHGQKTDAQIKGDIRAKLGGLASKLTDVGVSGKGSINQSEFEGLTQEATAEALKGDRACRERVFDKLLDKLSSPAVPKKRAGSMKSETTSQTQQVKGFFARSDVAAGSAQGGDVRACVSAKSGWRIKRGSAHLMQLQALNAIPIYGKVEENNDYVCLWFHAKSVDPHTYAILAMYVEAVQWRPSP